MLICDRYLGLGVREGGGGVCRWEGVYLQQFKVYKVSLVDFILLSYCITDTGYCDEGWVLYGKKCYLFNLGAGKRQTYNDASAYCKREKFGELVSIHSK